VYPRLISDFSFHFFATFEYLSLRILVMDMVYPSGTRFTMCFSVTFKTSTGANSRQSYVCFDYFFLRFVITACARSFKAHAGPGAGHEVPDLQVHHVRFLIHPSSGLSPFKFTRIMDASQMGSSLAIGISHASHGLLLPSHHVPLCVRRVVAGHFFSGKAPCILPRSQLVPHHGILIIGRDTGLPDDQVYVKQIS
jgi:hypothetical protein